ncbi:MAG: protein kinase [Candidatus Melainabacteria bacterium]|nr:protein kinase [Candidatus Melainabacteria bacterium]
MLTANYEQTSPLDSNSSVVKVIIVEDHDLVRLSVKLSLESTGRIQVLGEATTGTAGIELARHSDAQVVIMDIGLPDLDGIEATRQIKESTDKKVIMLTSHADEKSILSALKAGADGFILKDTKTEDLVSALCAVADGAAWLEDSIARKVATSLFPRSAAKCVLTDKELKIMAMVTSGSTMVETARDLQLSVPDVHDQLTRALKKTALRKDEDTATSDMLVAVKDDEFEAALICKKCYLHIAGDLEFCPEDGTALTPDPLIGSVLTDRYTILSLIGTGGNGAVYKAKHRYTAKTVAVKVLHSDLSQSTELVNRFRQEAIAIANLDHPNLVSVIDFGMTTDGTTFMVMDYLEGKSLVTKIREDGPMDYRKAVPIFMEVCKGVERAHEAGIVHRDLKPGNVHVCSQEQKGGLVKVLDFGLAKVFGENNVVMTVPGEVFGSPAYMSPEQCRGQKLDKRTDVYSMGCLMYQVLSGETVFTAQSATEVMYHQIYTQPKPFSEIAPGLNIPLLIEMVVMKCLAKSESKRYQTMEDLHRALRMCAV